MSKIEARLKELGIVECRVNTAKFAPSALPRPSAPARRRRPRIEPSDLAAYGARGSRHHHGLGGIADIVVLLLGAPTTAENDNGAIYQSTARADWCSEKQYICIMT